MISEQPYSINAIWGGTNDLGTSESFIVGNAAAVAFSISHPISDIGTACIGLLPRNVWLAAMAGRTTAVCGLAGRWGRWVTTPPPAPGLADMGTEMFGKELRDGIFTWNFVLFVLQHSCCRNWYGQIVRGRSQKVDPIYLSGSCFVSSILGSYYFVAMLLQVSSSLPHKITWRLDE